MKKGFAFLLALLGWFAVIAQYVLMLNIRVESVAETTMRFFSFFTILTNIIVAIYFTGQLLPERAQPDVFARPGSLTAVTCYITIVGLIYQFVLRGIWQPEGLQKVVDELLHSVIPAATVLFWLKYELPGVNYQQIGRWMWYPLLYLAFILVRGYYSVFYPYPFIHVQNLGWSRVLFNSLVITALFLLIGTLLIFVVRRIRRKKPGLVRPGGGISQG